MASPIQKLWRRFQVVPALQELDRHPDLWNRYGHRTKVYATPHSQVDDIWVRYNDYARYTGDPSFFSDEHDSVWYADSDKIPAVKDLCMELMAEVRGERLGGVLITRVPPGGEVAPHIDHGWHARYYDKFAIQLMGNQDQTFWFEEAQLSALPGECYTFDNSKLHAVYNRSDAPRMTLIVCIRGASRVVIS